MSPALTVPAAVSAHAARILVVDDNATHRKAVLMLLRHEGYNAIEAVDGADGLRAALAHRPQLVISDILMPSMDGYEFVRQLRANPELASTAVMFYTANYHSREAQKLAEQCGVARVLVKPGGARALLSAVTEVLAGAAAPPVQPIGADFDRQHLQVLTDTLSKKADQLGALNSRFAALTELNVQLASEHDPSKLLERVCAGARNLLGAKYAVLAVAEAGDGEKPHTWVSGTDMVSAPVPDLQMTAGLPAEAQALGRALRVRVAHGSVNLGLPAEFPAATCALVAPISSPERSYGWLCLADKIGAEEFDADDEQMLNTLGAQVGRIYENGRLYRELQQYATQLLIEMEERERTTAELRNSEERFRQLAENIDDALFMTNAELSTPIYVSPAYNRIWGRSNAQLTSNPAAWLEAVHPEDRERVIRAHESAVHNWPAHASLEFRIVRPDGQTRWISERLFPILDAAGKVVRAVGIGADVTERRRAETRIVQLSRVHAMLSGINSLIVRVSERDELFREACRLAVEAGHFRAAWCALLDPSSGRLQHAAACGALPEEAQFLNLTSGATVSEASPVQQALRSQRPVIYNDLQRESASVCERDCLLARGIRGLAALPLVIAGTSVGCLLLMTGEAQLFDAAETALLVELAGDISFALDHIAKAERLNHLAYYDSVSGLANRTLFAERLAIHVDTASRSNGRFALVIIGPERIEGYNEALGRAAGDELLRQIAERLVHIVGDAHLIARTGNDEFAAVIPGLQSDYAVESTIERWWKKWPGPAFQIDGQECAISAKAGVALYPADGSNADTLLRNGRAALKKAKSSGSRHVFYTPNLTERLSERLKLETHLRRAVENEELILHYQPKVDMATRRLTGVEALMRWQSPQLGAIPPNTFIPILEETGLIVEAGAWALRQACLDRSRWLEQRLKAPRIAVNVSAIQLRHEDFVRTITRILKLSGGEAGIDIEVTESLLMDNVTENIQKLSQIRELGVHIALDDFGTGYSSLSYLAKLPVGTLKIDRSFISAMLDDPGATTLVSTIISLARALRLETIAEGVESEEQAKILRLLQCDQMQGYLISRPISCDEMTVYLSRARS